MWQKEIDRLEEKVVDLESVIDELVDAINCGDCPARFACSSAINPEDDCTTIILRWIKEGRK